MTFSSFTRNASISNVVNCSERDVVVNVKILSALTCVVVNANGLYGFNRFLTRYHRLVRICLSSNTGVLGSIDATFM